MMTTNEIQKSNSVTIILGSPGMPKQGLKLLFDQTELRILPNIREKSDYQEEKTNIFGLKLKYLPSL
jgi:hypothetical protein